MTENIPVVDLFDFLNDNDSKRDLFVEDLGKAYETVDFVSVKNHGIPDELIKDLYNQVKRFFLLPLTKKANYEISGLAGQRGYTSFGKEHAKGSEAPDLKEFFQFGQIIDNESIRTKKNYPKNVDVKEIEGFKNTLETVYRHFEKSGASLLKVISLYLHLSENYFDEYIKEENSILRCIHYPQITQEPKSAIRSEQHEDINLITLLGGASADGLQILTKQGEWINVTSLQDQIVVNVGDMLQRLTNNKLKSTTHRVVNPPKRLWHTSRFSISFFLHPRSEMSLACLLNCIDENHPKNYDGITAGEYLDGPLSEIGIKK